MSAGDRPCRSSRSPRPASCVGIDWSDHLNYWNAGYAAVMVTDTAFYRNRQLPHDDATRRTRLDYRRMGEVVRGVYGAVVELAK